MSGGHVCHSCGRACGPCGKAADAGQPLPHLVREPLCMWCKGIYADNALDPETGRVHCEKCDGAFPGLAEFIAAGLTKYPRRCRDCRAAQPAPSDPAPPPHPSGVGAAVPAPLIPPDQPPLRRGGFVPRPAPETRESEHGSGPVEWPGSAPR